MSVLDDIKETYKKKSAKRRIKKLGKIEKSRELEEKKQALVERKYEIAGLKEVTRERKGETLAKKYGRTWKAGKTIKGAGIRVAKFTGHLADEAGESYGIAKTRLSKGKTVRRIPTVRARADGRSFMSPQGTDISLSSGIAANDWAGEGNIMTTEFFGNRDDRDLLGNTKDKSWDMQIFGSQNGKTNYLGSNKKKNQKFF